MFKRNMLTMADKDLMADFVFASSGRCLNRTLWGMNRPVPQGVTVYMYHPVGDEFEYLFTKNEKFDFKIDTFEEAVEAIRTYTNVDCVDTVFFYLNKEALKVASKHLQHSY